MLCELPPPPPGALHDFDMIGCPRPGLACSLNTSTPIKVKGSICGGLSPLHEFDAAQKCCPGGHPPVPISPAFVAPTI